MGNPNCSFMIIAGAFFFLQPIDERNCGVYPSIWDLRVSKFLRSLRSVFEISSNQETKGTILNYLLKTRWLVNFDGYPIWPWWSRKRPSWFFFKSMAFTYRNALNYSENFHFNYFPTASEDGFQMASGVPYLSEKESCNLFEISKKRILQFHGAAKCL